MMVTCMVWPEAKVTPDIDGLEPDSRRRTIAKDEPECTGRTNGLVACVGLSGLGPEVQATKSGPVVLVLLIGYGTPFICICSMVASELPVFCPPKFTVQQVSPVAHWYVSCDGTPN